MKKRLLIISLSLIGFVFLSYGCLFVYFLSTTYSAVNCNVYCIENTVREATSFSRISDDKHFRYAYWVAQDGNEQEPQELFVFREKSFWPFTRTNRWTPDVSSQVIPIVGSLYFTTYNDDGTPETTNTLVLFSSNKKEIGLCRYTQLINGKEEVKEIGIQTGSHFVLFFPELGTKDGLTTQMKSAYFYDEEGNFIYGYDE